MKSLIFTLILVAQSAQSAVETSKTGIPLDTDWKKRVHEFAVLNVKHCSWGIAHSERNYHNTLALAATEKVDVDGDVLFATAFLHDLGGIAPHEKPGVDHAVRSAELAEPLLQSYGFPMGKWEKVKEMILGHTYYGPKPQSKEAVLFRDADILDFLGGIGVTRIVAAAQEIGGDSHEQLPRMFRLLENFIGSLPPKLGSEAARSLAPKRVEEMKEFLHHVHAYTHEGKAL